MSELSAASSARPEVENPESTEHHYAREAMSVAELAADDARIAAAPEPIPPTPQQKTSAVLISLLSLDNAAAFAEGYRAIFPDADRLDLVNAWIAGKNAGVRAAQDMASKAIAGVCEALR